MHNQCFGLVKKEKGIADKPNVFEKLSFEGIVGLAFSSMLSTGQESLYDHMYNNYKFKKNEFSIYIGNDGNYSGMIFGGVDKKFYEGPIFMFPVVEEYYWEVEFNGLYINKKKFCCGEHTLVYDMAKEEKRQRKKERSFLMNKYNYLKKRFIRKYITDKDTNRDGNSNGNSDGRNNDEDDSSHIFKLKKNYLIFDSGTSFNSVPKSEMKYFFKLVPPMPCDDSNIEEVMNHFPDLDYIIVIKKKNLYIHTYTDIYVYIYIYIYM
uniref:Peptidase A1 domain-containing protein n=1 Tax=Piliocolobus tephrosceles TaxID=591936 RepID=A0A8C9LMI9_9PRIM